MSAAAPRPRLVVLFTDAGGGHRATAEALAELLARDAEVILVNPYREALAHLDLFARTLGTPGEQIYNRLVLRGGRSTGLVELLFRHSLRLNIRLHARAGHDAMLALWRRLRPDLVISAMPWLNAISQTSLAAHAAEVPFAILATDMEETWTGQWFPPGGGYVAICGTPALADGLAQGASAVHRTTGLLVRPGFLERDGGDRAAARRALGLAPDLPTLALLYGGHGSRRMLELALAIRQTSAPVQAVFLCGRDEDLARSLRAADLRYPHLVQGYTTAVPDHLRLADLFVGKPGPGSISEALALGLPVLLDAARVLPQERYNLRWAVTAGLGQEFHDAAGFRAAVQRFATEGMARQTEVARGHANRAAMEIPGIIGELLKSSRRRATAGRTSA